MTDDPAPTDPTPKPAKPARRFWSPRVEVRMLRILIVALAIAGLAQFIAWTDAVPVLDFAVANIATQVIGCIAATAMAFVFAVSRRGWLRFAPLGLMVIAFVAFFSVFRILQTTGELIPTFTYRWAPLPDERLVPLSDATPQRTVDLSTTTADDFPQFLGPERNGRVVRGGRIGDWATRAPRQLWQQPIGAGWSAFSAVNGFAVTMEQRGADELVTCYEIQTGQLRWFHTTRARHRTIPGGIGPRSTPTIHLGRVYTLGATGVLLCLDGSNGDELWKVDLLEMIGVTPEQDMKAIAWGRAASPLVVDEMVILPLGGPADGPCHSLAAFSAADGELVWKGGASQVSYASPQLATLAGVRQILIVNESTVAGHDPASGAELWSYPWPGQSNAAASCSQAVPVGNDQVLLSKGYGAGASLVKLQLIDDRIEPTTVWSQPNKLKTKFANVVVADGHAYGLSDGILECVEIETGTRRWKQGRYRQGQVLLVDRTLLVLAENGDLAAVKCSPDGFEELRRVAVLDGTTWNNLCLYGNRLLVRNAQQAACLTLER